MDEKEKERREAFMKTYGVTEEEMNFFGYIHSKFERLALVITGLVFLLILLVLGAIVL